jgi:hypothetical protein
MTYEPRELEAIEREEQESRLRFEEHRERQRRSEGEAPTEDQDLLRRLEAEWRSALDRLHRARGSSKD